MLEKVRLFPSGVEGERRTAGHRVRDQVHGDLRQGQHQRRGGFLHARQGHQGTVPQVIFSAVPGTESLGPDPDPNNKLE